MRRRQNESDSPLLYDVESAAALLSVGRGTVYGLIAAGDLKSVKIGRQRRIAAEALHEYVASLADAS